MSNLKYIYNNKNIFPVDISVLVKYLKEAILKQLNNDTSTAALKIKFTN